MKDEKMNVEALSRAELLTLLSILEGELEAQDVVIHALRAQQRDSFIQERYCQYDLSDPFLALQRDSESEERRHRGGDGGPPARPDRHLRRHPLGPNPLAVLKLVMAHCKRMQERMASQLAAAESRHKQVMSELQEEQRRSVVTCAQQQELSCSLQGEREQLLQQLEEERGATRRLQQEQEEQQEEQKEAARQAEESLAQQQQLSAALRLQLQQEALTVSELRGLLEEERKRAAQLEAEWEAERQQARARIGREEGRSRELERQLEDLRKEAAAEGRRSPSKASAPGPGSKVNGHRALREAEPQQQEGGEPGGGAPAPPPQPLTQPHPHPLPLPHSPSSTTSPSSLCSSPASSPVLAKRPAGPALLPASYQAGVNQRFQAARHKFQSQAELEQQQQLSPRDLSPVASPPPAPQPPGGEHSAARQLARHTVTQVLSRFTGQQGATKLPAVSSSPFGTDYRNVATAATGGRSPSSPVALLSPGLRSSPFAPSRPDKTPPPPPKKPPGMSPTPGSPSHGAARSSSSSSSSHFPELTGSCGHGSSSSSSSGPDGTKEADLLVSSSS